MLPKCGIEDTLYLIVKKCWIKQRFESKVLNRVALAVKIEIFMHKSVKV